MRFPDFMIIGAMKAGTTTLYRDLLTNPAIYFPYEKEKSNLLFDEVLTPQGRREYSRLFEPARPAQLCGIAPSSYTKLPDRSGVPGRARAIHGPGLKAIYLVREPVARAISQYRHEIIEGTVSGPIDEVLLREPRFVDYSRYAMQVTPWLETFGPGNVLIERFETYVADRRGTVERVSRFLGVEPHTGAIEEDVAFNRSAGKPTPRGLSAYVWRSRLYRDVVRPWLSPRIRERLRMAFMPRAVAPIDDPSPRTVRWIIERLGDDPQRLQRIMGRERPLWDFQEVLRSFGAAAPQHGGHPAHG
jgi:hypothetical protein